MAKQWSKYEINFLKENYPKYGIEYCMNKFKFDRKRVQQKACKLQLKLLPETKSMLMSKDGSKCNINPDLFYNITDKEVSYLLGLIWSDGFLYKSKDGNNHHLGFTMVKEDIDSMLSVLDTIGRWNYYERKQTNKNWKPSINVLTNNKRIFNFLLESDYGKKSHISADKILSKIPENLKHYFFLGLIDGDGCFYHYKPKNGSTLRQFSVASTFEQDWGYFEYLCNELDIKYSIQRNKNGKSSSSYIRVTNKGGIKRLGEFIYQDYNDNNIGLDRKYNKFKLIVNC